MKRNIAKDRVSKIETEKEKKTNEKNVICREKYNAREKNVKKCKI